MLLLLALPSKESPAQNISFRALAPDAITVTNMGNNHNLEFDKLLLDSDIIRTIAITDSDRLVALAIDAPANYDLTVHVNLINGNMLILDGDKSNQSIPFTLEFAYANLGYQNTTPYSAALVDAVAVAPGFSSVSFPVSRRASGLPPPPPMPEYKGFDLANTKKRAFLFFFGSVGPANAGNNVVAGTYSTFVDVIIDFTSYDD